MSQDFSVLLHTPTDGTDGDCTASLKNPRGIEPRRILPQPRGSQAHTCMSPQSSDCLTFIHNLKPSDPSIFFRTPQGVIIDLILLKCACCITKGINYELYLYAVYCCSILDLIDSFICDGLITTRSFPNENNSRISS